MATAGRWRSWVRSHAQHHRMGRHEGGNQMKLLCLTLAIVGAVVPSISYIQHFAV